jgi:hypothetical protein
MTEELHNELRKLMMEIKKEGEYISSLAEEIKVLEEAKKQAIAAKLNSVWPKEAQG